VACANVSGLLASRAPARAREMAMRLAIGASRSRVVRQLVTESLLVAIVGGAAGLGIGYATVLGFQRIPIPVDVPLSLTFELDRRVLMASLAATVASALLFGVAPACRHARISLVAVMKQAGGVGDPRRAWGRSGLVIAQVALSVVVLIIALATHLAFSRELLAGPGYRTDHLLMLAVEPQFLGYDASQRRLFHETLRERVMSLPGVTSTPYTTRVPMGFTGSAQAIVPELDQLPAPTDLATLLVAHVDESYFSTMNTPILAGRGFHREDDLDAPLVALVNETAARRFWPNGAVGRRFRLGNAQGRLVEVVGIAQKSRYAWLAEPPLEFLYLPYRQHPQPRMTLVIQSAGDPANLAAPVRGVVRSLDSRMPITDLRTMENFYDHRVVHMGRAIVWTVAAMGLVGLALAIVGVYGLVAQSASQRTKEIGIRIAIGANPASIVRMVLRQGVKLAIVGLVAGLPAGIAVQRMMQAVFPARTTFDPLPLLIVVPVVLGVAFLASYLPARHAASIDPLRVLGSE
jgi:predicted permease